MVSFDSDFQVLLEQIKELHTKIDQLQRKVDTLSEVQKSKKEKAPDQFWKWQLYVKKTVEGVE